MDWYEANFILSLLLNRSSLQIGHVKCISTQFLRQSVWNTCYWLQANYMTESPAIFSSLFLVLKSTRHIEHCEQNYLWSKLYSTIFCLTSIHSSFPRDRNLWGRFSELLESGLTSSAWKPREATWLMLMLRSKSMLFASQITSILRFSMFSMFWFYEYMFNCLWRSSFWYWA